MLQLRNANVKPIKFFLKFFHQPNLKPCVYLSVSIPRLDPPGPVACMPRSQDSSEDRRVYNLDPSADNPRFGKYLTTKISTLINRREAGWQSG